MSGSRILQIEIVPIESFKIIRKCSGCGGKSVFSNTDKFRINANGRLLDVWLIYQCEKCSHTYNLTIHERFSPAMIPPDQYRKFLANDKELAYLYGTDSAVMAANRAEVDRKRSAFRIIAPKFTELKPGDCLEISNPKEIKMRTDKAVAQITGLTGNQVRHLQKKGMIEFSRDYIGRGANVFIHSQITLPVL